MATKYTIRDSIMISLITLVGGALVNSQVLVEWADRMEYGSVREYALNATLSLDSIAEKLCLNQPQARIRAQLNKWRSQPFPSMLKQETRFRVTVRNNAPRNKRSKNLLKASRALSTAQLLETAPPSNVIARTFGMVLHNMLTVPRVTPSYLQQEKVASDKAKITTKTTDSARIPHEIKPQARTTLRSLARTNEDKPKNSDTIEPVNRDRKPNVLIVGDSLMGGVGPRLKRLLRKEHGFPSPKLKWKASTGLSRPDYFDWPKTLNGLLAEKDYDVVVAIFGTNDTQPVSVNRKSYRYGTKAWFEHYRKRVVKVLDMMCKTGNRSVFWIGLPTMRSEAFNEKIVKMNQLYREELNRSTCGQYIPMDSILSPDGQFTSYLKVGKKRRKVRAGDGIHLSFVGYDYVARRVIDTILTQTNAPQRVAPEREERTL